MNLIPQVFAQRTTPVDTANVVAVQPNQAFFGSFNTMLTSILNIVLIIGTIFVLVYLVWGGLDWLNSGGDKGKTESARNKITAAIIGLIIIVSAWAIFLFVTNTLLKINVFNNTPQP